MRNNGFRSLITAVLCVVMVLALTACSGKNEYAEYDEYAEYMMKPFMAGEVENINDYRTIHFDQGGIRYDHGAKAVLFLMSYEVDGGAESEFYIIYIGSENDGKYVSKSSNPELPWDILISSLDENFDKSKMNAAIAKYIKNTPTPTPTKTVKQDSSSKSVETNKPSSTNNSNNSSSSSNGELLKDEYWCMGKNDSCKNKTYSAYDLYCSSCDPDGDNIEG